MVLKHLQIYAEVIYGMSKTNVKDDFYLISIQLLIVNNVKINMQKHSFFPNFQIHVPEEAFRFKSKCYE